MKWSMHSILVSDYPHPGKYLIYHTRTQALVKIDQTLKTKIDHFDSASVDKKDEKFLQDVSSLYETGILVQDSQEDIQHLQRHMQDLKYAFSQKRYFATILTTYACNFKCTYCFEESTRTNEKMNDRTVEATLNWLQQRVERFGYKEVYLNFYGGEPLVNKPALEKISAEMKQWCSDRKIIFHFMIQTNGYLLTKQCVEKYLSLGLSEVRISVDGVQEDHDRTRPLRNGGKTFDVVMKNIIDNVDLVPIGLSTSYHKGDISHIQRLIGYLKDKKVLDRLGEFIFSPIHATLGPKGSPEKIQGSSCMCNYEDKALVESNRKIRELMKKNHLPMKSGMALSTCPLTRDESGVTIDQNGRIYKCNSMLGHPELSTGDVFHDEFNQQHQEFIHLDVWDQCPQDCTYMPMCAGGCRLSSFLNNQSFKVASCHKKYLNQMAESFIKKDYDEAVERKQNQRSMV